MSAQRRFPVIDIPGGSPGKRLDATGMDYPDLDVYTCSDRFSNDVASVNITACELMQNAHNMHTHTHTHTHITIILYTCRQSSHNGS